MVRYEEIYCKLLTSEYTGSEIIIKMALDYVNKQIKHIEIYLKNVILNVLQMIILNI